MDRRARLGAVRGNAATALRRRLAVALAVSLLAAPPATAQDPSGSPAPAAAGPPPATATPATPDCATFAAERTALATERETVRLAIADIAMGRTHRRRPGAGAAGRAAGGAAATLLLPFGIGLAVNAGAAALQSAGKKKKRKARPPAPEPDVPALIARQQAIEARLAEPVPPGCMPNGVAAGR